MNTSPKFLSTSSNDLDRPGRVATAPVERWEPVVLQVNGESITVTNFSRELPATSTVSDRTKLVRAGQGNPFCDLPEDAWHALSRAVVYPAALAAQVLNNAAAPASSSLSEEHVGGATLRSGHGRVWLTEVLPLIQPRIGQDPKLETDPEVIGELNVDGAAQAALTYRFRDRVHLENYLKQTIAATRAAGNQYDPSILARRVTRAVVTHTARIEFEDGSEYFYMLVVRDGISRVVSAWAALFGEDDPHALAERVARVLLAEKAPRQGTERTAGQRLALGRQEELDRFRATHAAGSAHGTPSEDAIRIGQTAVLPAQIALGLEVHPGSGLPVAEVFDDAVRSVLASIHVEFKGWEPSAQHAEVGSRALKRTMLDGIAVHGGVELQEVYRLAVGVYQATQAPAVFRDEDIPGTPLWRAVYLVHFLTRKPVFDAMKKHLKDIGGWQKLHTNTIYSGVLGTIIDLPWRSTKRQSLNQARNAWANGGVLTKEVMADWQPVPCANFTELVEPAMRGSVDARITLAVAGGIVLIADKLLTRNVGSAVGVTVPFRSDVDDVVAGLSRSDNQRGLLLLANAANVFDGGRVAVNSLTDNQLVRDDQSGHERYVVADVDPSATDGLARDAAGAPKRLSMYTVVSYSNPERATQEEEQRLGSHARPPSILDQIVKQRHKLLRALTDSQDAMAELMRLGASAEASSKGIHPLGSFMEWTKLSKLAVKVQSSIFNHEPEAVEQAADGDDEADGED